MASKSACGVLLTMLTLAVAPIHAQAPPAAALREALAPTGTLRAVFLETNPMQARIDPVTGDITGPAADVAHELARRAGVPLVIEPREGVPSVIEAVVSRAADIGFIAYDPTRAAQVAYSQPYILGHNSYVVRADSPIRTLADADRAGLRIASRDAVAVDLYLTRTITHAELLHLPRATEDAEAVRRLLAGEFDAYAANTERLAAVAADEPGVRIVDGSLMNAEQSIVVTLDNSAGVHLLDRCIDELRSSGFLQGIVDRYRIAGVEMASVGMR
jgi:polar amino acid transport system substrate-binding protein